MLPVLLLFSLISAPQLGQKLNSSGDLHLQFEHLHESEPRSNHSPRFRSITSAEGTDIIISAIASLVFSCHLPTLSIKSSRLM